MIAFISYRREDSQPLVNRIRERLIQRTGHVFRDIDSIPPGNDARRATFDQVGRCDLLLVVIGQTWLTAGNAAGVRRLSDPSDHVRLEIEAGLQRNIPIIPLLVDGARIPRESDLPPSLKPLAYRQGIPVRNDPDFNGDMERVLTALSWPPPPHPGGGSGPSPRSDYDLVQTGCGGAGGKAFGILLEGCSDVMIEGGSITDVRGGQGGGGVCGGAGGDAGAVVVRGQTAGVEVHGTKFSGIIGGAGGVSRLTDTRGETNRDKAGTRQEPPPALPTPGRPAEKIKILFLTANPVGTVPLRLDEEAREIETKIRMAEHRDSLELITKWAVRPGDLLQYLNQYKPHIVHFSGHGSPTEEIILLDKQAQAKAVSKAALVDLFKTLKDNVRVVLLNACFSRPQAEAITEQIDCAIGMKRAIGDEAAITFASSFYRAIGFGRSVQEAFDQGRVALLLEGIPEDKTPELLTKTGADAGRIVLVTSQ